MSCITSHFVSVYALHVTSCYNVPFPYAAVCHVTWHHLTSNIVTLFCGILTFIWELIAWINQNVLLLAYSQSFLTFFLLRVFIPPCVLATLNNAGFFFLCYFLQNLTYDTPAADQKTLGSTVLLKVANQTVACSTTIDYYPDPEFTSFSSIRTGEDVRITLQVMHIFEYTSTNGYIKLQICFCCHFRKMQTNWRWPWQSCPCGALRKGRNTPASWRPNIPIMRQTFLSARFKGQPTLYFHSYW